MNWWIAIGTLVWFFLTIVLTCSAVAGLTEDDNSPICNLAPLTIVVSLMSWAGFIAFCLHMGGLI